MLPKPDRYGNYWLGEPPIGPAIFHASKPEHQGKYMASLGYDLLWDGNAIRYFGTPGEALAAIKAAESVRKRKTVER